MTGIGDYEFQAPDSPPSGPSFHDRRGGGFWIVTILGAIVVLVLALGTSYLLFQGRKAPSSAPAPAAAAAPPAPKAAVDDFEHIDLPPLDQSDALVRQRIGVLSSHPLVAAWLGTRGLVRNFVVVIDNIAHGMNPSRHLQILKPAGPFRVMTRGSQVVIDPRTYDRFSRVTEAAASIDAQSAGRLFRSFEPLLQMAYDELGNQQPVSTAVERAVVSLLQVPAIDGDIRVEPAGEGIGYEYSDARLEALNGAQKQLLRMGAKNIRIIQAQLRTFATTIGIPATRLN